MWRSAFGDDGCGDDGCSDDGCDNASYVVECVPLSVKMMVVVVMVVEWRP